MKEKDEEKERTNRKKSVRFHVTYLEAPEVLERYNSNENFLNFHNFCLRLGQVYNKENALVVERQKKVELENDAREVTVDITCALKERWDKWLFPLMLQFEKSIPNDTPTHLVPSVTIPARKTLWNSLQTDHFDIRLHAIFWGNFLNRGLMMAHWEISYYTPTKDPDMVKQKFVQADFFHDESYAQFSFQTYERDFDYDNRRNQRSFRYYTLRMYYASIKKMIVDINGGDRTMKNKQGNGKVHRIHFVLNAPVLINKMTQKKKEELERRGETKYGEGYRYTIIQRGRTFFEQPIDKSIFSESDTFTITFQEKNDQQLYEIISRIHFKSHCQVDFAPIQMVYGLLRKPADSEDITELQYVNIYSRENVGRVLNMLGYKSELKSIDSKISIFPFWYLLEGLLSRGAVVKDQILITETHYFNFLETVIYQWRSNRMRCEWALEELMDAIDQRKDIIPITELFLKMLTAQKDAQEVMDRQHIKEGYIRCRKIIITPTRYIYVAPEVMMGNRVIRTRGTQEPNDPSMDKYKILRVSFRDDNNQRMTSTTTNEKLIEECVNKAMSKDGIFVGGLKFTYLGNSNSQMRDHGCYFFMGEMSESEYIRDVLGRFRDLPNIAKVIARLGQCFTQSRESTIKLYRNRQCSHYDTVYDVIGGCDTAGKPYTYSDGVGQASKMFLATLAADLKLANRFIPSCIQFRFRGGKGVLTMDPVIDELIEFGSRLEFVDKETGVVTRALFKDRNAPRFHRVIFRESQMKFDAPKNDDDSANMEVVKYSTPTPVALNKPFINILDQVSDLQSLANHEKVCGRIDTLLDRHLKMISMVLIDETMCRNRLKELPHRFDVDRLNPNFNLSSEPFFRSLVKACVRFSLHKQLHKEQIQIPHDCGRSMFGVFDETGLLQYGQIYCRYTVNIGLKNAPPSASARTLLGTVLVTKNPCIVSGDVRLFEAVDIPQLRHLRDVIVFPRHGPRPHPNEMAGSDLDGDEYSVIWDPELMFDYNMPPMDFTSVGGIQGISKDEMTAQMVAYYREYMTQDQVGKVANAHLMTSDLFGLESQVASQIAKKCSEAVDFPKTGKAPDKLTTKWTQAYDPIKLQTVETPPEKAFRVPDFMEKEHEPVYRSQRMTGKVYRRVKVVKDILHHSEERDSQLSFRLDPTINIINWEHYMNEAREDCANYSADLKRLLDHYGIRTEAELLTGSILEMRNKLSDKDQDDMSFFNTTHMLEQQVNSIWTTYRQQFFENINHSGDRFGDYNECTVLYEKHFVDEDNPLHRHCLIPTLEMKKKAVAYYKIAYEEARHTTSDEGRILSFPWIVWDVIRAVKADYLKDEDMLESLEDRTFYSMMEKNMDEYCKENHGDLDAFCNQLMRWHATNVYCQAYDGQGVWRRQELDQRVYDEPDQLGLSEMLFYVVRWGLKMKIFDSNFRELHLALIFIQYAIGEYPGIVFDQTVHITKIAMGLTNDGKTTPRIRQTLRSPARLLTMFLQFVGSSAFRHQKHLLFDDFGVYMGFYDNEWLGLSQSATLTFYSLVFSSRFEELPCVNQTEVPLPDFAKEEPSFTIEMPFEVRESDFEEELKKKCGLVDVKLRRKTGTTGSSFANRVRVSAMGTPGALRKLHKIVTPEPIHNVEALGQKCDNEYAWRTVRNIRSIQEVDEYDID